MGKGTFLSDITSISTVLKAIDLSCKLIEADLLLRNVQTVQRHCQFVSRDSHGSPVIKQFPKTTGESAEVL